MGIQNLTGQTLGQYELRELLGLGGMGAVYLGYQANLKRQVAVKVLSPEPARQSGYLERFNREAETAAALEHRHIVPIYDYGMQQGVSYVVMRLLTGGTLADRLAVHTEEGKPLPSLGEIADVLKQLASALDYAHSQGVIHRDIKASNVMFDNQGSAYLVDFGIAKLVEATQSLTGSGVAMGTPLYMSPEQWKAEPVTPATDQYALGILTYTLITGRPPFEANTPYALMHKHLHEPPTPPQNIQPDVPEEVAVVLARTLAKKPSDRFRTTMAFAQAFDKAIQGRIGQSTRFFVTPMRRRPIQQLPGTPSHPALSTKATQPFYRSPIAWIMLVIILALLGALVLSMLPSESDKKGTPVAQVTGTPTTSRDQILMQTATELSQELTAVALGQAIPTPELTHTPTSTPEPIPTASYTSTHTITPSSIPPRLDPIPDQVLVVEQTIAVQTLLTIGVGRSTQISEEVADERIVTIELVGSSGRLESGDRYTYLLTALQPGSTTITVTLQDDLDQMTSVTFAVTVLAPTPTPTETPTNAATVTPSKTPTPTISPSSTGDLLFSS